MAEPIPALRELVEFAAGLRLESIPPAVRERAKLTILDLVAANLAGSRDPGMEGLARHLARHPGKASAIGTGVRTTAEGAALFNGAAIVALELDEGNQFARAHPGAHVWPAVLAVAEEEGKPGSSVLTAFIAGYEVGARIAAAFTLKRAVHPHGSLCSVGAAAALSHLWGYSPEQMESSLHQAASLVVPSDWGAAIAGATVRNLFTGVALRNAILATQSIAWGFTYHSLALPAVFGEILGELTYPEILTQELGGTWFVARNYFKMHACCQYVHSTLDAVMEIRRRRNPAPEEVEAVTVETYNLAARLTNPAPETPLAAKFSIPHAVAAALVLGETGPEAFGPRNLHHQVIRDLALRVEVREDPRLTAMLPKARPARVTVTLKNGERLVEECLQSRGLADNPFTPAELEEKFFRLSTPVIGEAAARVREAIWQLEELVDMHALTDHLVPHNNG
ncbi:MAG: MmgE/PrpD family protein [Armatimonadota bacterium]|nr:MmgE/PrpD family protein [Armatimonadota bacterium]MDR5703305.1 MmgE/PrpD family protein [Armatimonadota bacterium]